MTAAAPLTWRLARVRKTVDETATARTLVLDVPGWPGHRAGHHLDVRLPAEDLLVEAGHDPGRIRTERFGPT